jgi:hypothetical protein
VLLEWWNTHYRWPYPTVEAKIFPSTTKTWCTITVAWCCDYVRKKIRWGSQQWLASTQSRSTIGSSTKERGIGSHRRTCDSRLWRVLLVDLRRHSISILAQLDPEPPTTWAENWPTQSVAWAACEDDESAGLNWQ